MIVVPVFHMLLVPKANIYFQTEQFRRQAGRIVRDEKVVLLPMRTQKNREDLTEEDFYPLAVSGQITEINAEGYLVVHGKPRGD